eukprot:COSAG06_NODE_1822_length_8283_cov_33.324255_12_plen_107_part_01
MSSRCRPQAHWRFCPLLLCCSRPTSTRTPLARSTTPRSRGDANCRPPCLCGLSVKSSGMHLFTPVSSTTEAAAAAVTVSITSADDGLKWRFRALYPEGAASRGACVS